MQKLKLIIGCEQINDAAYKSQLIEAKKLNRSFQVLISNLHLFVGVVDVESIKVIFFRAKKNCCTLT